MLFQVTFKSPNIIHKQEDDMYIHSQIIFDSSSQNPKFNYMKLFADCSDEIKLRGKDQAWHTASGKHTFVTS